MNIIISDILSTTRISRKVRLGAESGLIELDTSLLENGIYLASILSADKFIKGKIIFYK